MDLANTPPPEPSPSESTIKRRACHTCHEVWPEHLMATFSDLWYCHACRDRAQADADAKKPRAYRMSHISADSIRNWGIVLTVVVILFYTFGRIAIFRGLTRAAGDRIESSQSWAKKPAAQWPSLAFSLQPDAASALPANWHLGPNACLIERADGSVICATAVTQRAPILDAQTDPEELTQPVVVVLEDVARGVAKCQLGAGNGEGAEFANVIPGARKAFERGMLFLSQSPGGLPKGWEPLRLRQSEYGGGMKMTVLARDPQTGAQVPLPATVVTSNLSGDVEALMGDRPYDIGRRTGDGSETIIRLAEPYTADLLYGAPVVDARGNLAAVVTLAFSPSDLDGRTTEFIAYGMNALRKSTEPEPVKK